MAKCNELTLLPFKGVKSVLVLVYPFIHLTDELYRNVLFHIFS